MLCISCWSFCAQSIVATWHVFSLAVGRRWLEKIHGSLRDLVEDDVLSGDDEPSNSEESEVDVDVVRAPVAPLVDGGVPVDQLDAHQLTDGQLLQRLAEACVPWSQPFFE